jgi:hypothetical protein
MTTTRQIILETLDRINTALASDPNALLQPLQGQGAPRPEAAYCELVQTLLGLDR